MSGTNLCVVLCPSSTSSSAFIILMCISSFAPSILPLLSLTPCYLPPLLLLFLPVYMYIFIPPVPHPSPLPSLPPSTPPLFHPSPLPSLLLPPLPSSIPPSFYPSPLPTENGFVMVIWVGQQVTSDFISKVFGAPSHAQINTDMVGQPSPRTVSREGACAEILLFSFKE